MTNYFKLKYIFDNAEIKEVLLEFLSREFQGFYFYVNFPRKSNTKIFKNQ